MMTFHEVMLSRLKFATRKMITREFADACRTSVHMDHIADRMIVELRRDVYSDALPPEDLICRTSALRHASWWDVFKATYRGRWWWPAALSRVRYVEEPIAVRVNVRAHWTFPDLRMHGEDFGRPYMVTFVEEVPDGEVATDTA